MNQPKTRGEAEAIIQALEDDATSLEGVVLFEGEAKDRADALDRIARDAGYTDFAGIPGEIGGGDTLEVREVTDPEKLLELELKRLGYVEEMSAEVLSGGELVRLADSEVWVGRVEVALAALRGAHLQPATSVGEGREGHDAVWEALQQAPEVALCDHCGEESGEVEDGAVDTEHGERVGKACQVMHVEEAAALAALEVLA